MNTSNSTCNRHYFDWAATALPEYSPAATWAFGNPSSPHREGRTAHDALENARVRCAAALRVPPETLYFTSGGTESNCIPLYSFVARQNNGRVLASAGEHSSIIENLRKLDRLGKPTGLIPIDSLGSVSPALLAKTLKKYPDARLVAIMAANNETGAVSDMAALRDVIRNQNGQRVHLHCDMVQAAGKINLDIAAWDVDSASFSAHKLGGPRGIGLLYLRKPLEVLYSGGGQERNIRPGTENIAGAIAMGDCFENHVSPQRFSVERAHARQRWQRLLSALAAIERCRFIPRERNCDDERFSPYIVQAAFRDIPGEVMARALDDMGFAVSTGSACSSNSPERPVLTAMGIKDDESLEGIRVSQGWSTTDEEIDLLLAAIAEVLKFL